MSYSITRLGTNAKTYSFNPDRGGEWAHYLQTLSQSNNHDRQIFNGEVNAKVGAVPIDTDLKKVKASRVKRGGNTKIDDSVASYMKSQYYYNPRYNYHGDA